MALVKQVLSIDRLGLRAVLERVRLPGWRAAAAFLAAYLALEWLSFIHELKGVPVTPWNPGLGVAFAMLVLGGGVYALVLFAGVVIAELFVLRTELGLPVVIAIGAIVSASYAAVAGVARRHLGLDAGVARVRDVLLLLSAGVAGAAIVAVLLSLLLLAAGDLDGGDLVNAAVPLFIGDVIGIAVMTPLLLRLAGGWRRPARDMLLRLVPELALWVLVSGFTFWMIFGMGPQNGFKLFYLLFVPVVAAAVRHGIDGSCMALATTQLALVGLLHVYGYDARGFTEFQALMLVLTLTGLLVGAVVSERQQADGAARQAEAGLKDMQAEAARAARLNMVSGMASALAHEINQPMTAARALARSAQQLLIDPGRDIARAERNLATLVTQIDHAGEVVRRMREFLRRGRPHFSTLDIKSVLDDALALAKSDAAAHGTRIDLQSGAQLPFVFGDRVQLQQVVLNLVRNAVEAITEAHLSEGRIQVMAHMSDDAHIEVCVIDNGAGIAPGRQLFEPLSSTKAEGLGLGLSICASIVQAHGGRIWLQSSQAGATEFRFSLPVSGHKAV